MKLYKLDTKGKTRYLDITAIGSTLRQESGVIDTDSPVVHTKECTSKNVGRSNETSPEEQALLEMDSKIEEKLTEGYFKTLSEVKTEEVILPMLAKSYKDEYHKIDWNACYIQPKLDGQRCLAKDYLMSRQGKIIDNVNHILNAIPKTNLVLDGELYLHGIGFQGNMKLIKKYRKGETEKLKYCVYDLVSNEPFISRYNTLIDLVEGIPEIWLVPIHKITSEEQLKKFHKQFIEEGYEGSIIRWGDVPYKVNGRSSNLLKYKDFQDVALPIVDITPNEVITTHGTPWFELNNKRFKAGVKASHEDREDLLKNKKDYIGKIAELRYFELSEEGTPRFPIYLGLRLDK